MSHKWKNAQNKRESGPFVPLARCVLRSHGYSTLSAHAVKLLNDLLAQYNGHNNGDLTIAWSMMATRSWRSKRTLYRARDELLSKGFVMCTRQGGRHKASLYAVTFFAIDECGGKLEVRSTLSPPGTWKKNEPPPKLNVKIPGREGDQRSNG